VKINLFLKNQKIPKNKKWFYFGSKNQTFVELKKILNKDDCIEFSKKKDEIFKEELNDYLLWTEKNRERFNDSIYWWSHELAGKNNLNSDFYLYICQINFINKIIKDAEFENLIIICEDIILKKALIENLNINNNYFFNNFYLINKYFLTFLLLSFNTTKLLMKFITIKILMLFIRSKLNFKSNINIFHSSGINITNSEVKLNYFPGINLKERDDSFFIHLSKKSFFQKIKEISYYESKNFIFVERFVNFINFLNIIFNFFKSLLIYFRVLNYKNYKIKFLIFKELIKSSLAPDLNFQIWSYLPLFKKLSKITNVNNIFDHYENMTSEHLIIGAAKKANINTKIFGYHHTFSSNQFLCWNNLLSEWKSNFKPDYIISSGDLSKDYLVSKNCPENKIIVGPPLRYNELINKKIASTNITSNLIVVPLSQIKDHSYEIILKTFDIYKLNKDYKFKICPHPNLEIDNEFYSKYLKKEKNFSISDLNYRDTLAQSQFVISSATGAVYDALILDKIVLNLKSDINFCDNYLDFLEEDFKFLKKLTTIDISNFLNNCEKNHIFLLENLEKYKSASNNFVNKLKCDKDFFELINKLN
tara:strand:+ start:1077 stop:2846 length:1770 start_codon:yes stop_codon:yes gene_type:complete